MTTTTEFTASEPTYGNITYEELQMAFRNPEMPLEAMEYDLTPAGLHYLVIHWDIPRLDSDTFRLGVGGSVRREVELSLGDLRAKESRTVPVTLECAGNGRGRLRPRPISLPWLGHAIGTAEWTGVPVGAVLDEAGLDPDTVEIVFYGADRGIQGGVDHHYGRSLTVDEAMRSEVILAYEMNGQPLLPQHGHPLRLIVPGWYGFTSVKWLTSIEAVTEPFAGYQQTVAFRYQDDADDPGVPVDRIRVRAMMIPPGIPDAFSRSRVLEAGPVTLKGRAWSGHGEVTKVEVSADGGTSWQQATLEDALGEHAWRGWHHRWEATPGVHELTCRATDSSGEVQPLDQRWNYQGMGNNAVQRVEVTVA